MKIRNLFFTIVILFFFSNSTLAQNTYVPDDNFEQALIDLGFDSGSLNDSVPTNSINTITALDISGKNIVSLIGIEDFVALTELNFSNNQLSGVDLSSINNLSELICYNNQLTELDLNANIIIENINCANNNISELDLSSNTTLKYLNCSGNQLTTLNLKNGNNTLMTGDDYRITGIDTRNNSHLYCTQVDNAEASKTYTTWFKDTWTAYNEDCTTFQVKMAYVPDDNFEQYLIDYGYDSGFLNDSVPTTSIENITLLNIANRNIADLTGIEEFKAIEKLYCYYNQITNINLSTNTSLQYLDCSRNQITTLELGTNALLTSLHCSYNEIIDLDVSSNTFLTYLNGENNQLTSLNVRNGNNSNLTIYVRSNPNLFCIQVDDAETSYTYSNWDKNGYTAYSEDCSTYVMEMTYVPDDNFEQALIDMGYDFGSINDSVPTAAIKTAGSLNLNYKNISNLTGIEDFTNLTYLSCYSNQLTELNLESNILLEILNCSNNNLIDLNLSSNSSLTNFTGSNNQLTGLNLKNGNNSNLSIDVRYNPDLLCIQVDDAETAYTYTDWYKNGYTGYSEDCSTYVMEMTYVPDDNFEQALIDKGLDFGVLNDSVPTITISEVKTLLIENKNISVLTGIEYFTSLERLYCSSNQLKTIDLSSNTNLKNLSCCSNQLNNLDISTNPALQELLCYGNQLTSLNLKNGNNKNLRKIRVFENPNLLCIQVDDAEASYSYTDWFKNWYTEYSEDCANNKIEMTYVPDDNFEQALIDLRLDFEKDLNDSIPTIAISTITSLKIDSKNISDLTGIEKFTALKTLHCSTNQLDSINLTLNINLENFRCSYNQLTKLNLSENTLLQELSCCNTQLTNLDLSKNSALQELHCYNNNQLTSLDLRNGNNHAMVAFLENNSLFCIQVDNPASEHILNSWSKDDWASYSENCGPLGPGIPIEEYNSLVDLYNSTIGEKWAINDNWLDTINSTVEDWYGVTVEDGHVTQILLSNNNLQNSVFENHVNLPKLRYLDLGSNSLTGFNFSVIDSLHELDSFALYQNFLIFEDLIPGFSTYIYPNYADLFAYFSQAKVDSSVYAERSINEQFAFSILEEFISTNDQFQWYKEGIKLNGETNSIINFSPVTKADSGTYYLEITNTGVPGPCFKKPLQIFVCNRNF